MIESGKDRPPSQLAETPGGDDDDARDRLVSNRRARRLRRLWRMLPSGPRCKICTSPFGAPIGPVLRFVGKGRWPGNPAYCGGCFRHLYTHREGAEVDCTMFFADIRGSTRLAEGMSAAAFRVLLDKFYSIATETLVRHEAVVDKYVGDEVVGIFVPALSGIHHARHAIEAALELLGALSAGDRAATLPVGIGIHTGTAYVGAVGTAEHVEFTALGDVVNVTARLASAAGPGELLVTDAAAATARWPVTGLERRRFELRGKSAPTDIVVLHSQQ